LYLLLPSSSSTSVLFDSARITLFLRVLATLFFNFKLILVHLFPNQNYLTQSFINIVYNVYNVDGLNNNRKDKQVEDSILLEIQQLTERESEVSQTEEDRYVILHCSDGWWWGRGVAL
jgi:hypothetical protein